MWSLWLSRMWGSHSYVRIEFGYFFLLTCLMSILLLDHRKHLEGRGKFIPAPQLSLGASRYMVALCHLAVINNLVVQNKKLVLVVMSLRWPRGSSGLDWAHTSFYSQLWVGLGAPLVLTGLFSVCRGCLEVGWSRVSLAETAGLSHTSPTLCPALQPPAGWARSFLD